VNIEQKRVLSEVHELYGQFVKDQKEIERRRSELFREFQSQTGLWSFTRPHDDESEYEFLEQRKTINSIHDEYNVYLKRCNAVQRQVVSTLTPPSETDIETTMSDLQRLKEMTLNLEPELQQLQEIVVRYEVALNVLRKFNSLEG
jgi:hypothetical protein